MGEPGSRDCNDYTPRLAVRHQSISAMGGASARAAPTPRVNCLSQTSDVIGHRCDFSIGHLRRHCGHERSVLADTVPERLHLRVGVVGMLAGKTWELRGDAGA